MQNASKLQLLSALLKEGNEEKAQETLDEILITRKKINGDSEINHTLKIYIAGPYTPKNASMHDAAKIAHENTVNAINFGIEVIEKGHLPYIPHLSHFMHLYGKKTLSYRYYTEADIEWLHNCDAILYYGNKIGLSKGADNELKIAIDSGKRVFFSVNEIPTCRDSAKRYGL
jgi:hypothetical protein